MTIVSQEDRTRVAEITSQIVGCLAPTPIDGALITDELVRDLEYHSLALVELAFVLEDAFEFEDELDREDAERIVTVGDVIEYIIGEMEDRGVAFNDLGEHAESVLAEVQSWGAE